MTKKSLNKTQQIAVAKGNSNEWDLSTLVTLLLQIARPNTLTSTDIQQLDDEDKLLKDLIDIRNKLEHHPSKSITNTHFNQFWNELSQILLNFGDNKAELDKIKDDSIFESRAQQISEENVKEAQRLNSLGANAHKEKNYTEAITFFTKSIELADISDHDRAIFYSNLSSSRLALFEQQNEAYSSHTLELINANDQRYHALQDAKHARNLSSVWWKGHFRVGQVYAVLNEHKKAIKSFEEALALSPTNQKILMALDDSRSIYSRQLRNEHFDPRFTRGTGSEQLKKLEEKFGIDPKLIRELKSVVEVVDPATGYILKGHEYFYGDIGIEQDYEKAVYYYSKAAELGNAEGIYNLACLIDRGLGVSKDHQRAHELLIQAANQSPIHPLFTAGKNVGVAEAEHALGLRYAEGIVVHKHAATAAYWYERATEHGSGEAANNLAIMYESGVGVRKNLKKAEELFELAAKRDDPNAMLRLAELLLQKGDLQMAKIWHDRACESGNLSAKIHQLEFQEAMEKIKNSKNHKSFNAIEVDNIMETASKLFKMHSTVYRLSNGRYKYDYEMIHEYAERGSKTAQIMRSAMQHYMLSMKLLMDNENLTEDQENEFVYQLAQCYRLEHIVAAFPQEFFQKRNDIVNRVLQRCNTQQNLNCSELDINVRICYAIIHMDSFEMIDRFLLRCIKKYPRTVFFYQLSGNVYGWLKRYDRSLYMSNQGLELSTNHCGLLYCRAVALRLFEKGINETVKAYEAFLTIAPKDHRKVPESYYAIASCYAIRDKFKNLSDLVRKTCTRRRSRKITTSMLFTIRIKQ